MTAHDIVQVYFSMIIEVISLMHSPNGEAQFNFEYTPENDLIVSLPNAQFSGPCKVSAFCYLEDKKVVAEITLNYVIKGECSRCLSSATQSVNYEFITKFSTFPEEDEYLYKSGKVNLTTAVCDAIVISQPTVIYCKPNCKGLCPVCGANLNEGDCGHGTNN